MSFPCYVLYSKSIDKYYVGSSGDLESRLEHHNAGDSRWTKRGIPWVLLHSEECATRGEAVKRQKFIKRQKSKAFTASRLAGGEQSR